MTKQEKATAPTLLTETETDHVAGGAPSGNEGNHFGQDAKLMAVPAWELNSGNGPNGVAKGHDI